MHLDESSLLVCFLRESNEAVPSRDASDWIEHYLRTFAAVERANKLGSPVVPEAQDWISEHSHQVRIRGFRCEVSDEDTILLLILILGLTGSRSRRGAVYICRRSRVARGGRGHLRLHRIVMSNRACRRRGGPVEDERLVRVG